MSIKRKYSRFCMRIRNCFYEVLLRYSMRRTARAIVRGVRNGSISWESVVQVIKKHGQGGKLDPEEMEMYLLKIKRQLQRKR